MAIIKSIPLKYGYKIQLVSGKHIAESYRNNKHVKSCMSTPKRAERMAFYVAMGARLLRILDPKGVLVLRALVWSATDPEGNEVRFLDRIYKYSYYNDYNNLYDYPYTLFKEYWRQFADVRDSNKVLRVKRKKNYKLLYPYVDSFRYANSDVTELTNKPLPVITKWALNSTRGRRCHWDKRNPAHPEYRFRYW